MVTLSKKVESFFESLHFSKLLFIIPYILISFFVGYGIVYQGKLTVFIVTVSIFLLLCLIKLDLAICILIFLFPFHYVFKEIYSSVFTDCWREIILFIIMISWFCQCCQKKINFSSWNILNTLILLYAVWGIIEIFNSVNILVGLAGFRFMIVFIFLYFVVLSVLEQKKNTNIYIGALLISGFIVAGIAIIQFTQLSLLKIIEPGTYIDFVGKYSYSRSSKLGLYRATSVLASDNELGIFLTTCLVFVLSLLFRASEFRKKNIGFLVTAAITMFIALLFSMSRTAIIALFISLFIMGLFLSKKSDKKNILFIILIVSVVISIFFPVQVKGLFLPVLTLSDPYFTQWNRANIWGTFLQSPLIGHGYSITASAAKKLGLSELGVVSVGSVDIDFFQTTNQIGLVGYSLQFLILFLFIRNSYICAKSNFLSEYEKAISIAIFGAMISFFIASFHVSPREYVSLAGTYYLLGAISSFFYYKIIKTAGSTK